MAGPWEDYQKTEEKSAGPWQDYKRPATPKGKVEQKVEAVEKPAPEKSRLAKALDYEPHVGMLDASLHMGSGMLAGPVSDIAGLGAMAKDVVTGNKEGDPEGFKRHVQEAMTYRPKTKAGEMMSEYNPLTIGMKGVGKVADATGNAIGGGAAADTFRGAAGNLASESMKQGAGFAAAKAAPYVPKAGRAIKEVAEKVPMGVKLTPEMAELNSSAKKMGITLAPHQLSGNKYIKIAGSEIENVPLSGAKKEANQIAWERALIKEIGGDTTAKHLTPKVFDRAMRQSGSTIDRITGKYGYAADKASLDRLTELQNKVLKQETADNARIFNNIVEELYSKIPDGKMDGIAFRKFNSSLGTKIRNTADSDLKASLSDLQDELLDQFNKNVTDKADAAALRDARMQYAKAKTIVPMVGSVKGVNPSALRARLTNTKFGKELYARGKSSLKDLADIGDLLKDPNTSNTTERAIALGALGGAGAVSAPAAAGVYGAANLYNRFGHLMISETPKK